MSSAPVHFFNRNARLNWVYENPGDGAESKRLPEILQLVRLESGQPALLRVREFPATVVVAQPTSSALSLDEFVAQLGGVSFREALAAAHTGRFRIDASDVFSDVVPERFKSTKSFTRKGDLVAGARISLLTHQLVGPLRRALASFFKDDLEAELFDAAGSESDYVQSFNSQTGCSPFAWWSVPSSALFEPLSRVSNLKREYCVKYEPGLIRPTPQETIDASDKLVAITHQRCVVGLDIETLNGETAETLHTAYEPASDKIIMINLQIYSTDSLGHRLERNLQYVFEPTDELKPGIELVLCKNERSMLESVLLQIKKSRPDYVVGHNLLGFDMTNILARAKQLKLANSAYIIGLLKNEKIEVAASEFASKQKGPITTHLVGRCFGPTFFCTAVAMRKESPTGLRGFTLEECCNFVLGPQFGKDPVDYDKIHSLYTTPHGRKRLADYNAKDVSLTCDLFFAKQFTTTYESQARICQVHLTVLINRGQTPMLVGALKPFCKNTARPDDSYLFISKPYVSDADLEAQAAAAAEAAGGDADNDDEADGGTTSTERGGFIGGLVHRVTPELFPDLLMIQDFASLYPSIIRRYNVCFSTCGLHGDLRLLTLPDGAQLTLGEHYDAYPRWHIRYKDDGALMPKLLKYAFTPDNYRLVGESATKEVWEERVDDSTICVLRPEVHDGKCPHIATTFTNERKGYRTIKKGVDKELASLKRSSASKDDPAAAEKIAELGVQSDTLQSNQLNAKVLNNSLYGIFGAQTGPLYNRMVCTVIPLIGQRLNMETTLVCETHDWTGLIRKAMDGDVPYRMDGGKAVCKLERLPGDFLDRFCGLDVKYGDTDSVFAAAKGNVSPEEFCLLGHMVTHHLNTVTFQYPIEMELESNYGPSLMMKQKNYVAMYNDTFAGKPLLGGDKKPKMQYKGIDKVKRSTARVVAVFQERIFDAMLVDTNPDLCGAELKAWRLEQCKQVVSDIFRDIDDDQIPPSWFVKTCKLGQSPGDLTAYLAAPMGQHTSTGNFKVESLGLRVYKMAARFGMSVSPTDRLKFVVAEGYTPGDKTLDWVMPLDQLIAEKRRVSASYYIYSALNKTANTILGSAGVPADELRGLWYRPAPVPPRPKAPAMKTVTQTRAFGQALLRELKTCPESDAGNPKVSAPAVLKKAFKAPGKLAWVRKIFARIKTATAIKYAEGDQCFAPRAPTRTEALAAVEEQLSADLGKGPPPVSASLRKKGLEKYGGGCSERSAPRTCSTCFDAVVSGTDSDGFCGKCASSGEAQLTVRSRKRTVETQYERCRQECLSCQQFNLGEAASLCDIEDAISGCNNRACSTLQDRSWVASKRQRLID